MGAVGEWISGILKSREAVFSTARQKEEAVRAFLEFASDEGKEAYQNVEQLKEVCRRIDQYVSQAKPRPAFNRDQTLVLDPFFDKLLDFVISMASVNTEIHDFLRDETSMLATLTSYLNDKYQIQDQAKILKTIEVLTRGIVVPWSVPYLSQLIKQTFALILATKSPEISLLGMRIVSNLIFDNQNCLNMVLRDANYRTVLKHTISLLSQDDASHELTTMALNFCFLTDQAINMNVSTQIANIKKTFTEIQGKLESQNLFDVQGVATTVYYISLCVSTILDRCARDFNETSTDSINGNGNGKEQRAVQQVVEEVFVIVFDKFFTKSIQLLRTEKGQMVVVSLLSLLKSLCPINLPTEEFTNLWEKFVKSLNELSMVASSQSNIQVTVLETHIHFVNRILKSSKKNSFSIEAFKHALNNCQVMVSSKPVDLSRNILTIRLLNRLHALASLHSKKNVGDSVTSKVTELLSEEPLSKLLYELLSEKTDDCLVPCIQMSTCVVEVLSVISKLSKNATTLMGSFEKEKTWFHIANCIVNGNEDLISQALALMGAVGFSTKCRLGVARILLEMRESYTPSINSPTSPERLVCPSLSATMGIKRLNDNLELFEQNHVEGNDQAIDDVLAWYKLKNDLHEMELSNMNDHIYHLNRANIHLKILLNKQSELIAKRAVSASTMKKDFSDLQRQLEVTKEKKVELESKHMKAVQSLRQQLSYQEEIHKSKFEALLKLEKELKEAKVACAELKVSRDEAVEASRQVTTEKRKLQEKLDEVEKEFKMSRNKCSTLEVNLKKSEEARKTAEALLEAERRKTEIIQQVLGNRS